MAAYTALVSLLNTIDLIKNHSRHSFWFDENQIASLWENARFFLEFIEINDSSHGRSEQVEDLETQIVSAARLAEDALESHAVDQILSGSTLHHSQKISSFLHGIQIKVKAMKKKVMEVPKKLRSTVDSDYRERKRILALFPSIEKSPSYSFHLKRIVDRMDRMMEQVVMKVKDESRVKEQQSTYSMAAASSRPLTIVVIGGILESPQKRRNNGWPLLEI